MDGLLRLEPSQCMQNCVCMCGKGSILHSEFQEVCGAVKEGKESPTPEGKREGGEDVKTWRVNPAFDSLQSHRGCVLLK